MSKTYRPWSVDQPLLLPPSVQELVPAGHLAQFVRDLVRASLDLSAMLGEDQAERGYPPYPPVRRTALLLYAYGQGLYSSRRSARAGEQRVDLMAVRARQTPDFRTISAFRQRHRRALGALFGQGLARCAQAGLVQLGHVALDGTKIKANASQHQAMSYGRMQQQAPQLAPEVAAWLAQAEAADSAQEAQWGREPRGGARPAWVANQPARVEKMREARAALEAQAGAAEAGEQAPCAPRDAGAGGGPRSDAPAEEGPTKSPDPAPRNFTDPDSRIMKTAPGFEQAYTAQAAVDANRPVIVAAGLTNAGNAKQQVVPRAEAITRRTGRTPRELVADSGSCAEANLEALPQRGLEVTSPRVGSSTRLRPRPGRARAAARCGRGRGG